MKKESDNDKHVSDAIPIPKALPTRPYCQQTAGFSMTNTLWFSKDTNIVIKTPLPLPTTEAGVEGDSNLVSTPSSTNTGNNRLGKAPTDSTWSGFGNFYNNNTIKSHIENSSPQA